MKNGGLFVETSTNSRLRLDTESTPVGYSWDTVRASQKRPVSAGPDGLRVQGLDDRLAFEKVEVVAPGVLAGLWRR